MKNLHLWGSVLFCLAVVSGCTEIGVIGDMQAVVQIGNNATETLRQGHCSEGLSLYEQANEKLFELLIAKELADKVKSRTPAEIEKMRADFKKSPEISGLGVINLNGQRIPASILYAARCYMEVGQLDKGQAAYQSFLLNQHQSNKKGIQFSAKIINEIIGNKDFLPVAVLELNKRDWLNISSLSKRPDDETLLMALSQIKSPELFRQISLDTAIRYANFTPKQEEIAWSIFNQKVQDQNNEAAIRMLRIKLMQLLELVKKSPKFASFLGTPIGSLSKMEQGELFVDYTLQGEELVVSVLQNQHFTVLKRLNVPRIKDRVLSYRLLLAHTSLEGLHQVRQDIFDPSTQMTAWQENGYWWVGNKATRPAGAQALSNESYIAGRSAAIQQHEKWLYDNLLSNIETHLKTPQSILIAPDNILGTIPWFNLIQSSDRLRGIPISLVHSLGIYQQLKQRQNELKSFYVRSDGGQKLIVADPAYELTDAGMNRNASVREIDETDQTPPNKNYVDAYTRMQKLKWRVLLGARAEGNEVQKILGGKLLSAKDATEENVTAVLKESGKTLRYIHFATHGYLDPAFPGYSAIVLGKTGKSAGSDGYLTAWEIPSLMLGSELVVLSACETGINVTDSSDGVLGIPYALFLAGTSQTLVTLWPIDDVATRVFMNRFWHRKMDGSSAAKALFDTQVAFMKGEAGERYKDPVYWGAFMLYGGVKD